MSNDPQKICKLGRNFARNVLAARLKKGLTQNDVAKRTGLCLSYISMLERKQREPSLPTVEVLAKALSADPLQLLGRPA